jgi:hypothetical protein
MSTMRCPNTARLILPCRPGLFNKMQNHAGAGAKACILVLWPPGLLSPPGWKVSRSCSWAARRHQPPSRLHSSHQTPRWLPSVWLPQGHPGLQAPFSLLVPELLSPPGPKASQFGSWAAPRRRPSRLHHPSPQTQTLTLTLLPSDWALARARARRAPGLLVRTQAAAP